ncbi:MAG: S-methyl-5'-thioadenosine phosphorylase [Brevundimonas sp.]|uniref:S-methyl-5'-thioadenosine phosphorylase n=1 Tax=Brevundimonas sp. TaxID=1871086 RepID=UPI00261B500D|nr:S-methyl-5'-thioadenosine phosphorylase [Brevundimonas sp.]MDI6624426.1 S-methyl-5'-thioadenosine phosphorylase [Brevundimonas sp.]MDQ7812147.1 S-methyl-5'-thioadenosine phosphorylase [Brevundimonas sp.]
MTAGGTGEWVLGVIGGSGLYEIEGLTDRETVAVESPWGGPSDALVTGRLDGVRLVFLPRHGVGHRIPPGSVNARANIDVLKRAGCTDLLSISAVGSLREELAPGAFVVVDQFIDRTVSRPASFFDNGVVAHVSMADPVCPRLSGFAAAAAREAGAPTVEGGVYVAVEGPQFSTRAESELYRSWGASVIGMTAMPEARLAREAELPYASVCMVTDYDCWRAETAHVEVAGVLAMLKSNAETARDLIGRLVRALPDERPASAIDNGLDFAVVTDPALWPPDQVRKLAAVCPRKFGSG